MKKLFTTVCVAATLGLLTSCGTQTAPERTYNEGINIIPMPASLQQQEGRFLLSSSSSFYAPTPEAKTIAEFFAAKLKNSTGFNFAIADAEKDGGISLLIDPAMEINEEGYRLDVTPQGVKILAKTPQGVFYGMQSFLQLLPAEVESPSVVKNIEWSAPCVSIDDAPRFAYRGFFTQEEAKEIVAYAAERFITVIPELETPGHELAAISAYPELSCKGQPTTPRIIWGVEDIVMCPGKEDMFKFLEDVVEEMVPLFPGTYFHIGGDECPKSSWKNCPACQARIKAEGLKTDKNHTAEERLQSYVIQRMEKMLAKHGKKIIGWDEILEGGLSPEATVMSWRGEAGGIASALQDHDAIMTPGGNGMYLDTFQGDSKIEPVSIGGYTLLEKVYSYNPVPDTLVTLGKDKHIKGVQANHWSEYMYNTDIMEYRMYPRMLAVSEIAWTPLDKKDYKDFERRINNAYVRLDGHDVNYHIPQPEQPNGSCNFVAFVDSTSLTFKTTRPETMVYTLDGTDPTPLSTQYTEPIKVTETTTLKIRTVLPSGKMSPVRNITVEKQALAPAKVVEKTTPGLKMKMADGTFFKASELNKATEWKEMTVKSLRDIRSQVESTESMRGVKQYGAIATGYVDIPEDGVYYFTTNNDEVWIDGKLLISNEGEVKRFSRNDKSVALAKGLHELKVVFLGHIIGGWPSLWDDASISIRKADQEKFTPIKPEQLFY